jgi:hypothetical protein
VNLYQPAPIQSTTTPGKLHPPSPLYYDYTEDFDNDDYNQPESMEPPPQFKIGKTIPEDRPLSADLPPAESAENRGLRQGFNSGVRVSSSVASIAQNSRNGLQDSSTNGKATSKSTQKDTGIDTTVVECGFFDKPVQPLRDKKVIRLSGLGVGARELSTHVEEVFGLLPSPSFEIILPNNHVGKSIGQDEASTRSDHDQRDIETQSNRKSQHRFSANLSRFRQSNEIYKPVPPVLDAGIESSQPLNLKHEGMMSAPGYASTPQGSNGRSLSPSHVEQQGVKCSLPVRSASAGTGRRSSRFYSIDTDLNELADLITDFEDTNKPQNPIDKRLLIDGPRRTPMISPTLPIESLIRSTPSDHSITPPLGSFHLLETGNIRKVASEQTLKRSHPRHKGQKEDAITVPNYGESEVPNFSHHFPRKVISRSESPMLAPKPISPARQLKLKNSIPQLMKALPPLPPEPVTCGLLTPNQFTSSETELPCKFSPLIPEARSSPSYELPQIPESDRHPESVQDTLLLAIGMPQKLLEPAQLDSIPVQITHAELEGDIGKSSTPLPLPKLKLKMRNFAASRPMSPLDSHPWNLEESYPWSNQGVNVGLPPLIQDDKSSISKPPKFKLKITRASNSTLGTVRINRESGDSRYLAGLHLRHPKDLFTPTSGIENVFRQVSRHLHSRKASLSSNHHSIESKPSPTSIPISNQKPVSGHKGSDPDISQPSSSTSPNPLSRTDVRSFFSDDSSHIQSGHHSLRKRLSNLRARIAVPYSSRNGAHSHDDILWRDRNDAKVPTSTVTKSIPNLQTGRASTDARPLRRFTDRVHRKKLKSKVSGWLKEARSAITARMKSRSATGKGDEDQVQLTAVV